MMLCLVVLSGMLFSCQGLGRLLGGGEQSTEQLLEGTWKETWAVGSNSKLDYADEFQIRVGKENQLLFSCKTHPHYKFKEVVLEGRKLSFVLVNQKYTSDTPTVINYQLSLNSAGTELEGNAQTSKGKKVRIRWDKVDQ